MSQTMTLDLPSSFSMSTTSRVAPRPNNDLPSLDFNFDDLRTKMAAFTVRFDDFIERGRERVLEERNHFRAEFAQTQDRQATARRQIAALEAASADHDALLASQAAETQEMEATIGTLTSTRDAHAANVASLKSKLAHLQSLVAARKSKDAADAERLAGQRKLDEAELAVWEECLGMKVEGTGVDDRLRFVFVGLGADKVGSVAVEAHFVLDVSNVAGYAVLACDPELDQEKVARISQRLSEGDGEDLAGFLKGMRELFVEEIHRR
ncbi:hypothetical protein MRB53_037346 [Persea americana]|nr:hypothetical protein MRB53_037346 [Persea americana]